MGGRRHRSVGDGCRRLMRLMQGLLPFVTCNRSIGDEPCTCTSARCRVKAGNDDDGLARRGRLPVSRDGGAAIGRCDRCRRRVAYRHGVEPVDDGACRTGSRPRHRWTPSPAGSPVGAPGVCLRCRGGPGASGAAHDDHHPVSAVTAPTATSVRLDETSASRPQCDRPRFLGCSFEGNHHGVGRTTRGRRRCRCRNSDRLRSCLR